MSVNSGKCAEIVAAVASLLAALSGADDDEVVSAAVGEGIEQAEAELAVALTPCAFARALIRETDWEVWLPDEFRVQDSRGSIVRFRLSENPTYRAATELAEHQRVAHRDWFAAVAGRSAELNAVNAAFREGSDVKDGVFPAVYLARISAEEIARRRLRCWNRVRYERRLIR